MFSRPIALSDLREGDHVCVRRGGLIYSHHGIYVGRGQVIHYTDAEGFVRKNDSKIVQTSLDEFLRGGELRRRAHRNSYSPEKVVRRAKQSLLESRYSLLWNNCEHFATYCVTGKRRSRQVRRVVYAAGSAAIVVAGAALANLRRKAKA